MAWDLGDLMGAEWLLRAKIRREEEARIIASGPKFVNLIDCFTYQDPSIERRDREWFAERREKYEEWVRNGRGYNLRNVA